MQRCFVSYQDYEKVRHGLEVEASSLNEAVVKAVVRFRSLGYRIEDHHEIRVVAAGTLYIRSIDRVHKSLSAKYDDPANKELIQRLHKSRFGDSGVASHVQSLREEKEGPASS